MPVQTPEPIALEYLNVVRRTAAIRGGLDGLALTAHVAYRQKAAVSHQETFRRRVSEELDFEGFTVEAAAAELGEYKGNTLRLWLKGKRAYDQELLFAFEWWLKSFDRKLYYSPFSTGAVEAARAEAYCEAVRVVRSKLLKDDGPKLDQCSFWQLHHMYTLLGWQQTVPSSTADFEGQALRISERAAWEYTELILDVERFDPPNDVDKPWSISKLRKLDQEWGLYYLTARLCLARGADDQHVLD